MYNAFGSFGKGGFFEAAVAVRKRGFDGGELFRGKGY